MSLKPFGRERLAFPSDYSLSINVDPFYRARQIPRAKRLRFFVHFCGHNSSIRRPIDNDERNGAADQEQQATIWRQVNGDNTSDKEKNFNRAVAATS